MPPSKSKPLTQLLSAGDVEGFNRKVTDASAADLVDAHLRGLDLRRAKLSNADLRGAYLRLADLRGLDLSHAKMEGASLLGAHVSGTLFPANLSPEELRLSLDYGTRLRVRS